MSNTTNLQLPYLDANQNQKTVTVNQALTMLDALVNCQVQSAGLTAPPAAPADGQCWIVGSGATGAWAGKDLSVAAWQDGAWAFYPPTKGMLVYNDATATLEAWIGSAWVSALGAITQLQLNLLGIGTEPDGGNPLSATLNNALFNALGTGNGGSGDIRVKLNKQGSGNTASFLFQDGFSGRAEIGLTGDDDFHFKVSPDGSTFVDGLKLVGSGGYAVMPTRPAFSVYGAQSSATAAEQTWSAKDVDQDNNFNLSTGRFTAPVAGNYFFTASLLCSAASSAADVFIFLKNGAPVNNGRQGYSSSIVPFIQIASSTLLALEAGDTVSLKTTSSIFTSNDGLSTFCGFFVG